MSLTESEWESMYVYTEVRPDTLESEVFWWAITSCEEHFRKGEGRGENGKEITIPVYRYSEKHGYDILDDKKVIKDMIYRLDTQLGDMMAVEEDVDKIANASRRVVKKLKKLL